VAEKWVRPAQGIPRLATENVVVEDRMATARFAHGLRRASADATSLSRTLSLGANSKSAVRRWRDGDAVIERSRATLAGVRVAAQATRHREAAYCGGGAKTRYGAVSPAAARSAKREHGRLGETAARLRAASGGSPVADSPEPPVFDIPTVVLNPPLERSLPFAAFAQQ
jgi:hypothetical protein